MNPFNRLLISELQRHLGRGKSILLLGPRQTGKTTLVKSLDFDEYITFSDTGVLVRYEKNPGVLIAEIRALQQLKQRRPLVILDEVQKLPSLMDDVQVLIDEGAGQFVLTGSSVRKLHNLLPGRVVKLQMDPLVYSEFEDANITLEAMLNYGTLPGILNVDNPLDQDIDLKSYVDIYLEEEVRKESMVRNLGHFARFLNLAASESGTLVSFRNLSQDIGIGHTTVAAYYRILEDCLVVQRFDPLVDRSSRRRLIKSPKYVFFDLGVRRVCAEEGAGTNSRFFGPLFEQWVGLELRRLMQLNSQNGQVKFWRDTGGPEVDWVIEASSRYCPVEVKWTATPTPSDVRHLKAFMNEYSDRVSQGYVVCRTPKPMMLSDNITAIPWQNLGQIPDLLFSKLSR